MIKVGMIKVGMIKVGMIKVGMIYWGAAKPPPGARALALAPN